MKDAEKNTHSNTIQKQESFFGKERTESFFSTDRQANNSNKKPFFSPATIQPKLTIGQPNDKYEQEADAMADQVVGQINTSGIQRKCASCNGEKEIQRMREEHDEDSTLLRKIQRKSIFESNDDEVKGETLQRKCNTCEQEEGKIQAKSSNSANYVSDTIQTQLDASKGSGNSLSGNTQKTMESTMGADFSKVRIHTGNNAIQMNKSLGAQAFTHGSDVYFNAGKYDPDSTRGQFLLAHELTHVVQQGGGEKAIQKTDEEDAELERKVSAFKSLVKTTAQHRLRGNIRNLELWKILVNDNITDQDFNHMGLSQSNGVGPLMSLQDERNPAVRELRAHQVVGRYRACTGCHYEVQARNWGNTQPQTGDDWMTPNELRAGQVAPDLPSPYQGFLDSWSSQSTEESGAAEQGGETLSPEQVDAITAWLNEAPTTSDASTNQSTGSSSVAPMEPIESVSPSRYNPDPESMEGRLNTMYPQPGNVWEGMEKVMPILNQLGPDGYDVLPPDIIHRASNGNFDGIRESIQDRIDQRIDDYNELIELIGSNEVGYEHFGPIIRDLFPLAEADVRAYIQEEMDDNAFWAKVEMVVVGIASVAALLLTIFPPTSVLGVATLAALEVSLGVYGVSKGMEMMDVGHMYSLGTGADNVFSEDQQRMGNALVLGGFISVLGGFLSFRSGWMRSMSVAPRLLQQALVAEGAMVRATPSLLPVGANTFQKGQYMFSLMDDGAVVATIVDNPNLMIIVRDNMATLYQRMGGGGLRVLGTAQMPTSGAASGALATTTPGPLALSGGSGLAGPLALPGSTGLPPYLLRPGTSPVTPLLPGSSPLLLTDGNPTSLTLRQLRNLRGQRRWQEAETYTQQLTGSPGQQHFPVPATGGITGTGGRFVDSPVALPGGGTLANEVKMYQSWTTVNGTAVQRTVPLSNTIEQQILKDVWLRDNVPGYDPRWLFLDAPPSPALSQFLTDNNIVHITYH